MASGSESLQLGEAGGGGLCGSIKKESENITIFVITCP
jgi:hypothetical protein